MQDDRLIDQVLGAWRVHDGINVRLLQAVPAKSLDAIPLASRGRNVAQVFAHMREVPGALAGVVLGRVGSAGEVGAITHSVRSATTGSTFVARRAGM